MGVPSAPGLHRVDWDLRHALPDADGSEWAAHDPAVVPRTLDQRGPFVSPGIYTLQLAARGTTVTGNASVAGYPDLPLTVEDYRELPIQVGNPTTISNDSSRCAGKRRSRRYRPSILKAERPTTGDSPTPPPKITDSPPTHLRSSAS